MAFYLAERYVPSMGPEEVAGAIGRIDEAAAGGPVRHVLSVLVHGEDTCLTILEAPDAGSIGQVTDRAGFRPDRIVEVTAYPGPALPAHAASRRSPSLTRVAAPDLHRPQIAGASHQPSGSASAASSTPSRNPCGLTLVDVSP